MEKSREVSSLKNLKLSRVVKNSELQVKEIKENNDYRKGEFLLRPPGNSSQTETSYKIPINKKSNISDKAKHVN